MVFLWLLLQFILTVQRDVQQRILEHSMGAMDPQTFYTRRTDFFSRRSPGNQSLLRVTQEQLL